MENKILKIKKRNGEIVDFNQEKSLTLFLKLLLPQSKAMERKQKDF